MSKNNGIIVGSGQSTLIHGYGKALLPSPNPPLSLNNVLHAPKLIKNFVSVRQFTTDNNVSVSFYPFGFSMHDLQTGRQLMRCDNTSSFYPITTTSPPKDFSHSSFLASALWHDRLGHLGTSVLDTLQRN